MRSHIAAAAAVFAGGFFAGCASRVESPREFTIGAGEYARTFDATRDVLGGLDFTLERIDAASGVISTAPHFSPGLLEPWDRTQTGLDQEWEDTLNMQARQVRVTFAEAPGGSAGTEDLRRASGDLVASVRVTVYRQQRAGRRLDSEWVGGSTFYFDPRLAAQAGTRYLVPIRRDERLESRVAESIRQRLASAPTPGPAPDQTNQ